MKKGINYWSFAGADPAHAIELAAKAGFEGIELCLDEGTALSLDTTDDEVRALGRLVADHGLEVTSIASGMPWSYPITSANPDTRAMAVRAARRQIEIAAMLDAGAILLVPGYVGCDFVPGAEVVPVQDALQRAHDGIASLVPFAEEHGIDIGVENVWNKMLQSPLEMRDFIDGFNSPRVGSYFDVANAVINGYPEDWVRVLGSRIRRVHFKDYRRAVGTVDGFVGLLSGDVNFPEVVKALGEVGYDGYVTGEILPSYTHHVDAVAYITSIAMDHILGRAA